MRKEYKAFVGGLAVKGVLGWSSGSTPHMVLPYKAADGHFGRWPIVEISLTPAPYEPRTSAVALKSLDLRYASGQFERSQPRLAPFLFSRRPRR